MWPLARGLNQDERRMLPISMDEHNRCSMLNRKEMTKQKPCICYAMQCNAILESKLMLVKFDSRLSFLTRFMGGYLNHVRQALHASFLDF